MTKRIGIILSVIVSVLLSVSTETHAQGQRWSLSPRAPFPCDTVSFDGGNAVFRKTLVIVCDGKEQLEMPAGSILGVNATCSGTTLILSHDVPDRGNFFEAARGCGQRR